MKLKDVEIVVMSDEEYGEHLNQLFERVRRGEIHEPEPHKIMARTAEDIGKILTRERLRLLAVIREKTPESISELARILKRKESNVYNDLTFLEGISALVHEAFYRLFVSMAYMSLKGREIILFIC